MSGEKLIARRPAVHWLCEGVFIQETISVSDNVHAVPLRPVGYSSEANYTALYARQIGAGVDEAALTRLIKSAENSHPVVAIVVQGEREGTPEQLEEESRAQFNLCKHVLAWVTGDEITPFGLVTATGADAYFRLIAPHSRRRLRLGFGNTGPDFSSQVQRIAALVPRNERFAFALSLYHDALREDNPQFKIARLFSCLEALASKLKNAERRSRKAVRYMLGLNEDGASGEAVIDGKKYRYERIELAGRLRDKLFHGAPFERSDLSVEWRDSFDLIEKYPDHLVDALMADCELELARWANGASKARSADEAGRTDDA